MKRVCDVAEEVLKETGNPAVMWGDSGLLDTIAERAGLKKHTGRGAIVRRHNGVLNALSAQPGNLVKGTTLCGTRRVRIFWLKGNEP